MLPSYLLRCLSVGTAAAVLLASEQQSDLAIAQALDKKILKLRSLTSQNRTEAIKALAPDIIRLPIKYSVPLASNLATDGTADATPEGLQAITSTLVAVLQKAPLTDKTIGTIAFEKLAQLNLYAHTKGSLNDSRYLAAVANLKSADLHRSQSDFKLRDLQGNYWSLKSLHGRVVLLNFWATWCPPCRAEIPDLNRLRQRFQSQGLVVLGVSEEDESTLRRFLSQHSLSFPVLLDPGDITKKQFLVSGFPQSYVFDRRGNLVAESISQTGLEGFVSMLTRAGLKPFLN